MVSRNLVLQSPDVSTDPRVSVGLPVYNGAVWLRETLESLLAQTYCDFELIISDNASTDETQSICEQYASSDRRIRYLRQDTNRGLCWNWNHVFEVSRSNYFKWAACDDLCLPTFLESAVGVLDQHADVAWCHTLSRHIDSIGKPVAGDTTCAISHIHFANGSGRCCCRTSEQPAERFKAVLLGQNGLDCYGLIRSEVIRKTALLLPHYGAEKVLLAELALRGRFFEIPETLFLARIHEEAAGNLHSQREQRRLMNPVDKKWRLERLSLLRGYISAIQRAELPLAEQLRCYGAITRYLLQVRKWKCVLRKAMTGAGLAGEYPSVMQKRSKAAS
jgi:glycosyltransferase involved in cell wall biosynthesis